MKARRKASQARPGTKQLKSVERSTESFVRYTQWHMCSRLLHFPRVRGQSLPAASRKHITMIPYIELRMNVFATSFIHLHITK